MYTIGANIDISYTEDTGGNIYVCSFSTNYDITTQANIESIKTFIKNNTTNSGMIRHTFTTTSEPTQVQEIQDLHINKTFSNVDNNDVSNMQLNTQYTICALIIDVYGLESTLHGGDITIAPQDPPTVDSATLTRSGTYTLHLDMSITNTIPFDTYIGAYYEPKIFDTANIDNLVNNYSLYFANGSSEITRQIDSNIEKVFDHPAGILDYTPIIDNMTKYVYIYMVNEHATFRVYESINYDSNISTPPNINSNIIDTFDTSTKITLESANTHDVYLNLYTSSQNIDGILVSHLLERANIHQTGTQQVYNEYYNGYTDVSSNSIQNGMSLYAHALVVDQTTKQHTIYSIPPIQIGRAPDISNTRFTYIQENGNYVIKLQAQVYEENQGNVYAIILDVPDFEGNVQQNYEILQSDNKLSKLIDIDNSSSSFTLNNDTTECFANVSTVYDTSYTVIANSPETQLQYYAYLIAIDTYDNIRVDTSIKPFHTLFNGVDVSIDPISVDSDLTVAPKINIYDKVLSLSSSSVNANIEVNIENGHDSKITGVTFSSGSIIDSFKVYGFISGGYQLINPNLLEKSLDIHEKAASSSHSILYSPTSNYSSYILNFKSKSGQLLNVQDFTLQAVVEDNRSPIIHSLSIDSYAGNSSNIEANIADYSNIVSYNCYVSKYYYDYTTYIVNSSEFTNTKTLTDIHSYGKESRLVATSNIQDALDSTSNNYVYVKLIDQTSNQTLQTPTTPDTSSTEITIDSVGLSVDSHNNLNLNFETNVTGLNPKVPFILRTVVAKTQNPFVPSAYTVTDDSVGVYNSNAFIYDKSNYTFITNANRDTDNELLQEGHTYTLYAILLDSTIRRVIKQQNFNTYSAPTISPSIGSALTIVNGVNIQLQTSITDLSDVDIYAAVLHPSITVNSAVDLHTFLSNNSSNSSIYSNVDSTREQAKTGISVNNIFDEYYTSLASNAHTVITSGFDYTVYLVVRENTTHSNISMYSHTITLPFDSQYDDQSAPTGSITSVTSFDKSFKVDFTITDDLNNFDYYLFASNINTSDIKSVISNVKRVSNGYASLLNSGNIASSSNILDYYYDSATYSNAVLFDPSETSKEFYIYLYIQDISRRNNDTVIKYGNTVNLGKSPVIGSSTLDIREYIPPSEVGGGIIVGGGQQLTVENTYPLEISNLNSVENRWLNIYKLDESNNRGILSPYNHVTLLKQVHENGVLNLFVHFKDSRIHEDPTDIITLTDTHVDNLLSQVHTILNNILVYLRNYHDFRDSSIEVKLYGITMKSSINNNLNKYSHYKVEFPSNIKNTNSEEAFIFSPHVDDESGYLSSEWDGCYSIYKNNNMYNHASACEIDVSSGSNIDTYDLNVVFDFNESDGVQAVFNSDGDWFSSNVAAGVVYNSGLILILDTRYVDLNTDIPYMSNVRQSNNKPFLLLEHELAHCFCLPDFYLDVYKNEIDTENGETAPDSLMVSPTDAFSNIDAHVLRWVWDTQVANSKISP